MPDCTGRRHIDAALFSVWHEGRGAPSVSGRPQSGDGDRRTELQVEMEGKAWPFQVTVREIPYEEEKIFEMLKSASEGLGAVFLNGNTDFEHVMQEVSMPSVFPGYRDRTSVVSGFLGLCGSGWKRKK